MISLIIITTLSLLFSTTCNATLIEGDFEVDDFFKFIIKFGFQKTEKNSAKDSFGYVFGNITANADWSLPVTLALLDKHHFLEYYGNRSISNRNLACKKMFSRLNATAFDSKCNVNALGDYLRRVPCKNNQLCVDEDSPANLVSESQFTYVISNLNQPRFWYLSIVSCYRNLTTCEWEYMDTPSIGKKVHKKLQYSITLVNGNPRKEQSLYSPFVYHFSYDQQNILEQCLIFFAIYIFLMPIQIHASKKQFHPLTKLFTLSLILEFVSICFILVYLLKYASTGTGNETVRITGDVFDILSRTSFMLILLLLAKGWAVTRLEISRMSWFILITIWLSYLALNVFLYVWNMTEIDVVSDIDEFQTWPGWLVLISRSFIMLWFLYELRNTMKYEHSSKKLDFLLHFGASSLVWFIYLPIIALISMQVSPFWRYKLLLAVTNSVDCLAYCVMMGLLWPNRSGQYLLLAGDNNSHEELDEFNEAPHVNRENYTQSENHDQDDLDLVLTDDIIENNVVDNSGDNLLLISNGNNAHKNNKKNTNNNGRNVFT
ncbi:unnamed protein product [Diamesa serratosioi]